MKDPGYIVKTKAGKIGRTFHSKPLVNNKMPVYLATKIEKIAGIDNPVEFSNQAILCHPQTLTQIGHID